MAERVVTLDLTVKKTGSIKVAINPWERHAKVGDTIVFKPGGDVTGFDVIWHTRNSPFVGGKKSIGVRSAKAAKTTHVKGTAKLNTPYRYTVKLYFNDPAGNRRSVTVDPDMVIEA